MSGFPVASRFRTATLLCAALFLGACDAAKSPTSISPPTKSNAYSLFDPEAGFVAVGALTGPLGTYDFHTDAVGGGLAVLTADRSIVFATTPPSPATSQLYYEYFPVDASTWPGATSAQVTVSEVNIPAGRVVDSIRVVKNGVFQPTLFLTNSVTVQTTYNDVIITKFYHSQVEGPPPPPVGKGCTPGYWKQSQHFDSWVPTGLKTTDLVGKLFSNAYLYKLDGKQMSKYTLVEALSFQGGSGTVGSAQILLRAAVAAELNARNQTIGYPMSAGAIVTAVQNALASVNRGTMILLASQLDDLNNLGCVLN
jgi:hypothetical protein